MTSFRRLVVALAAASALFAGAGATAHAAAPTAAGPAQTLHVAPAAPTGNGGGTTFGGYAPSVTPAVQTSHVDANGYYLCKVGYLCALAWDPTTTSWKVFHFWYCDYYDLAYWNGGGYYLNQQTNHAQAIFYNSSWSEVTYANADGVQRWQDWNPVYHIRSCG
ncbi:hypothetical protein HUT18_05340 [Streptomyces sp. NA04227]|uniref:hypothetical protein n=1 Tax=Streptomyces sp. NA04227 TaxID=2742136 RepID=UPI0015909FB4|nr:hypothetical protein [Streptomyces sp. NA04227]QKW05903.1 hypothetical protein HUT18_05340 [Streptomyces sp. NA04227]